MNRNLHAMKRMLLPALVLLLSFLLPVQALLAQPGPEVAWEHSFGGSMLDNAFSVQRTIDGGCITAGVSNSANGDVTGAHGEEDYWVVKSDANGAIQWQHAFGGSSFEYAWAIRQTADGGYMVLGHSGSTDGDVTGNHGGVDLWLCKLNNSGELLWAKTYGGSQDDFGYGMAMTLDGGYILCGSSRSNDGDATVNHGGQDAWVVKIDNAGSIQWQISLGGNYSDSFHQVVQCMDGGYLLTGSTDSSDGDVTGSHGNGDIWVVKLDASGTLQWQKALGGSSDDHGIGCVQAADGGFVVCGFTASVDGDVTVNHGDFDLWVLKLDENGQLLWQKTLGGAASDIPGDLIELNNGILVITGHTSSSDGDVSDYHGGDADAWVVRLDADGNLQWQKTFGGSGADALNAIDTSDDGGYILAGSSDSNDGDVTGNHGGSDLWLVKTGPDLTGIQEWSVAPELSVHPNPAKSLAQVHVQLTSPTLVTTSLWDPSGRCAVSMKAQQLPAGVHELPLQLEAVPSGVYALLITINGCSMVRMLVKQ